MKHATDVHVDHLVPLVHLESRERRERHHAGVVHKDVDTPVSFTAKGDEFLSVFQAGDIKGLKMGNTTLLADLRDKLFQPVSAARAEHDASALAGEMAGGGFTDATAGSGNQNDFVLNVCIHNLRRLFGDSCRVISE